MSKKRKLDEITPLNLEDLEKSFDNLLLDKYIEVNTSNLAKKQKKEEYYIYYYQDDIIIYVKNPILKVTTYLLLPKSYNLLDPSTVNFIIKSLKLTGVPIKLTVS